MQMNLIICIGLYAYEINNMHIYLIICICIFLFAYVLLCAYAVYAMSQPYSSFIAECLGKRPALYLQDKPCKPLLSILPPQRQE